MPLRDAMFWIGLAMASYGGEVVLFSDRYRGIGIWFVVIGSFSMGYSVLQYHFPHSIRRLPVWIPILTMAWIAIGYELHSGRHPEHIPSWGLVGLGALASAAFPIAAAKWEQKRAKTEEPTETSSSHSGFNAQFPNLQFESFSYGTTTDGRDVAVTHFPYFSNYVCLAVSSGLSNLTAMAELFDRSQGEWSNPYDLGWTEVDVPSTGEVHISAPVMALARSTRRKVLFLASVYTSEYIVLGITPGEEKGLSFWGFRDGSWVNEATELWETPLPSLPMGHSGQPPASPTIYIRVSIFQETDLLFNEVYGIGRDTIPRVFRLPLKGD